MNPTCVICRNEVSRSADAVVEYICWEGERGTRFREKRTGQVAHIACLKGEQYNEAQLTITDVIGMEE